MNMKRNKIVALAMLFSTFLSPVSKAHGGTKQDTQKSSDSGKNLQNIKNKKGDNPQEMYNSRCKTNDIIKYFLETLFVGGVSIYGSKKVYNKYIRDSKTKEVIKEIKEIKPKIEPNEKLTRDSIAKKIEKRLDSSISDGTPNSKIMCRVYKKVVEDYKVQKGDDEFQKIVETKIPENKDEQNDKQFITWFQELNNEALDILLEGFSNEEKQFAKDNFKFYSCVWVCDKVWFVIAFAPKEEKIDLNGKKGKEVGSYDELFGGNNLESYDDILEYCEIDKK